MRIVWIVLFVGVLGFVPALAQNGIGSGYTPYGAFQDTLELAREQPFQLRPFIIEGSERVLLDGNSIDSSAYRLDDRRGRLWVDSTLVDRAATLVVTYRTLPFRLQQVYTRNRPPADSLADTTASRRTGAGDGADDPVSFEGVDLRRSGSISRAVVAGNRQDLTVESGLRMQLSGELSENVSVEAVLSDQNTPIQPDGTTQRLSDLDRVFINMATPFGAATMGDFEYTLGENTFAEFSRKLQGASARSTFSDTASGSVRGEVSMAGAISRGTYRFQDLEPVEGLQGPYRLTGKHGEPFIIVIAGSERVYLDGEELTRGASNDYVIDYATGEITFSSQHLITSDSRIAVEFEYTTNQYTRTLLGGESRTELWLRENGDSRIEVGARMLREADSRFLGEEVGFTARDSALVAEAGDAPAVASGAQKVPFDAESPYVQYVRRDTVYQGQTYTIYSPVRARADSVYRVRFTRVAADSASYQRAQGIVNGVAYEWAGPGNGQYEPVRVLPKPQRKRLFDIDGSVQAVDGVEIFGEWAQSVNEENRLSALDRDNDRGGAYRLGVQVQPTSLEIARHDMGELSASVSRRRVGAAFQTFDRTRSVEFNREWNLPRDVSSTGAALPGRGETETAGSIRYSPITDVSIEAGWGQLQLGSEFRGQRRTLEVNSQHSNWPRVDYRMAYVTSLDSTAGQRGHWLQQQGTVRKPLMDRRLTPFVAVEQERRVQQFLARDSLAPNSHGFMEWRPGVEWKDDKLSVQSSVEYRTADHPDGRDLRRVGDAWTGRTRVDYRGSQTFRTGADLIYRNRTYEATYGRPTDPGNMRSVVLRWNTKWEPLDRALQLNSMYEAVTQRTSILQETYVRTGVELGEYVWEDANEDAIRQVDEFIPERTPYEGTYAKTFVPSDELVPVIKGHARLHLRFEPARRWEEPTTWFTRALHGVAAQSTFEVLEESTTPRFSDVYLFQLGSFRNQRHTVNGRLRMGQRIELFRRRSDYGASFSFNGLRNMNRRSAGYARQLQDRWTVDGRYRLSEHLGLRLDLRREHSRSRTEAFSSRSYDISSWSAAPELSVQITSDLQASVGLHLSRKIDGEGDAAGQRAARIVRIPLNFRYSRQQRWLITGRVERASVQLDGTATGMAAFELTDGRGIGTSYLWNGTARYSINRFLNASFIYDGRIPQQAPPIHTLRMEVSATF